MDARIAVIGAGYVGLPLAVAFAAATVAAGGCTVANSSHGGYDPNTLRVVLSQEPPTLEPCESSLTSTGIVVRSNITEPLIERVEVVTMQETQGLNLLARRTGA